MYMSTDMKTQKVRTWKLEVPQNLRSVHELSATNTVQAFYDDDPIGTYNGVCAVKHEDGSIVWSITSGDSQIGRPAYTQFSDMVNMTEEEFFQYCLIWEYDLDVYCIREIQKVIMDIFMNWSERFNAREVIEY